jgi:hypothetical protein
MMEYTDNFKRKAAGVMISNNHIEKLSRAMECQDHTVIRHLLEDSLDEINLMEPLRDSGDLLIHNSKVNMKSQSNEVYSEFSSMYEKYLDEGRIN